MTLSSVITLANSIIGVSILAMPYCFKQCGIILATIMILLSGMLVKVVCHLLLKSALLARRRNFENLAFHTFGHTGKLMVELGIIGYLAGTAVAFFVVMGDLGPPIVANFAHIENTANLRLVVLTGLGLFIALPLSLIRNIESLQYICTASIGFYLMVVLRVVLQAGPHLVTSEWLSVVNLWRPAGMLQCFPIFSMALSCQTNIFEVYASLPDATPAKMNEVVKGAVNLCTAIYITIGFFGYVAFCYVDFAGDILTAFPLTTLLELIKFGFCMSVAISFPLVLFPCRTSLHSLLFRKTYQGIGSTELVSDYIPPTRFNMITGCLIVVTLIVGILIPDIELVLGLLGSTMGSCICVIFPGMMFLKLTNKDTTERLAARAAVVIGVITLILGTYVNLQDAAGTSVGPPGPEFIKPLPVLNEKSSIKTLDGKPVGERIEKAANDVIKNISSAPDDQDGSESKKVVPSSGEKRQEPAVPEAPAETKTKDLDTAEVSKDKIQKKLVDTEIKVENKIDDIKLKVDHRLEDIKDKVEKELDGKKDLVEDHELIPEEFAEELVLREKKESGINASKNPGKEVTKGSIKEEKLIKELEKQKEESAKILKEQKEILEELKEHKKKDKEDDENGQVQANNFQPNPPAQSNQNVVPQNVQYVPLPNIQQNAQNIPPIPQNNPIQNINQQSAFAPNQGQVVQSLQNNQPNQQPGQLNPQQQAQQPVLQQQLVQQPVVQQQLVQQQQVQPQQVVQQQVVQQQQVQPVVQQQVQQPVVQQQQVQQSDAQQQVQLPVVQQQQVQQPVVQQQLAQQPIAQQQQNVFQQNAQQPFQQQQPLQQQQQLGNQNQQPAQQQPMQNQQFQQQPPIQQQQQYQQQPIQQQPVQQAIPQQQVLQQQPNLQPVQQNQPLQQQPVVGQQQLVQQQQFQPQQQGVNQQQQFVQQQPIQQQAFAGKGNLQQSVGVAQPQPPVNNAPQQPSVNAPQQPVKPVVAQPVIQPDQVAGALAAGVPPPVNKKAAAVAGPAKAISNPVDNQIIQAAVKHGQQAYDKEQYELHKPVEVPNKEQIVPGRDLKADRSKRSAIEIYDFKVGEKDGKPVEEIDLTCLNDPFCDEKFSRNPISDSMVDRDLTKFMKVGKRSLLRVGAEANITEGDSRSL
eukprot:GFUD01012178.1.p1 GENE.GFUD01012178.1~~GFUD01012178.1.p1  ORF type:complete len:1139 (-),score=344.30 GFUD01012178.1:174-3590(-)